MILSESKNDNGGMGQGNLIFSPAFLIFFRNIFIDFMLYLW